MKKYPRSQMNKFSQESTSSRKAKLATITESEPKIQDLIRRSYQAADHLATHMMIEQKCQEWGVKMWIATIDFMKAFDSINHNFFWE